MLENIILETVFKTCTYFENVLCSSLYALCEIFARISIRLKQKQCNLIFKQKLATRSACWGFPDMQQIQQLRFCSKYSESLCTVLYSTFSIKDRHTRAYGVSSIATVTGQVFLRRVQIILATEQNRNNATRNSFDLKV